MIRTNAIQILTECLNELPADNRPSLREYVNISAESDCNFFRWLFNEDFEQDFDGSLTEGHKAEYTQFLTDITF